MLRTTICLFYFLLLMGCFFIPDQALAQGGPPMVTEDPGTPGSGRWEINTAVVFEGNAGSHQLEAPLLDVNYGWGDRIQLKVETPYLIVTKGGTQSGLGGLEVGVKYRFAEHPEETWAVSAYPQLSFRTPLTSDEPEFRDLPTKLRLPVQVAWSFGRFVTSFETGYQIVESGPDFWLVGVVAGYEVTRNLELLGEVHTTFGQHLKTAAPLLNVGAALEVSSHFIVMGSVGRVWPDDGGAFIAYSGIQFLL